MRRDVVMVVLVVLVVVVVVVEVVGEVRKSRPHLGWRRRGCLASP